jgi:hypothetical protein
MASNPHFLGNVFVKTQHFVGGAKKWTKASDTSITATIRCAWLIRSMKTKA